MPNQNGCARRPEIIGVRRPEKPVPGIASPETTLPAASSAKPPPDVEATASVETSNQIRCDSCTMGHVELRRRLCSGWSGILFGLLLSGGLLAAIYFGTVYIQNSDSVCKSVEDCGELFTDTYVCTTPQCDTSLYNLTELEEIARTRAYRKVSANLSWVQDGLSLTVNDHHDLVCTVNATGDSIYLAAEKAALSCISSQINQNITSLEYIVASETALLYADEWCAVDDADAKYCNTARCTCSDAVSVSDLAASGSSVSGPSTGNQTQRCQSVNGAYVIGQRSGDTQYLVMSQDPCAE